MNIQETIIKTELREQIALEEDLCRRLESQIANFHGDEFLDAKELLTNAARVLEGHYDKLNELLDTLEAEESNGHISATSMLFPYNTVASEEETRLKELSKILRDDYSALNLVAISNALLHTTALALGSPIVAEVSLKHLENLASYVLQIGELVPLVIARELQSRSLEVNVSAAETALMNMKHAWLKAK